MKKIFCLAALFLLLTSPVLAGQEVMVSYAVVDDQWWSGLCVHNLSGKDQEFWIAQYSSDGIYKKGNTFTLPRRAMKVDLLENFFDGGLNDTRVSTIIFTPQSDEVFTVTLFVGTDTGFAFQTFTSTSY